MNLYSLELEFPEDRGRTLKFHLKGGECARRAGVRHLGPISLLPRRCMLSFLLTVRCTYEAAGQNSRHTAEWLAHLHAGASDQEFAYVAVMHRPPHFQNRDAATHFAIGFYIAQLNDRICDT